MLVLADRAFNDGSLLADIAGRGAQFLVRSKANRRLPVLALLPDGTYLSRIADLSVRVIEAEITAAAADGSRIHGTYRLLTTLTDHHADPAAQLIRVYHERWEIETAYLALRHPAQGARAALEGPRRPRPGDVGPPCRLPSPAFGDDHRRGNR